MIPLVTSIGQASRGGKPVSKRRGQNATQGNVTMSQAETSLSMSCLTIRFQEACRIAATRTMTREGSHMEEVTICRATP